jgi:hypothetical protein
VTAVRRAVVQVRHSEECRGEPARKYEVRGVYTLDPEGKRVEERRGRLGEIRAVREEASTTLVFFDVASGAHLYNLLRAT